MTSAPSPPAPPVFKLGNKPSAKNSTDFLFSQRGQDQLVRPCHQLSYDNLDSLPINWPVVESRVAHGKRR